MMLPLLHLMRLTKSLEPLLAPTTMILKVIIVNYNGAKFIKNCLDSLIQQFQYFKAFEILVIDNASTDDSLTILAQYSDHITLIKNQTNVGFPAAHNQLLNDLDTPYLWLLNNDTEFDHTTDIITPIIQYLEDHPDVVGLSPKLLNSDGSLQAQGSGLSRWKFNTNKTTAVRFLSGASLFIRSDFFLKIQGFDPHLFFYNDDIDFAMQAKKHGKKLIYYPSLNVTHHGGLSTKFKPIDTMIGGYYGSIYLCKKYYPRPIFIIYYYALRLLIDIKKCYHWIIKSPASNEWVTKLTALKKRLKNEI